MLWFSKIQNKNKTILFLFLTVSVNDHICMEKARYKFLIIIIIIKYSQLPLRRTPVGPAQGSPLGVLPSEVSVL